LLSTIICACKDLNAKNGKVLPEPKELIRIEKTRMKKGKGIIVYGG